LNQGGGVTVLEAVRGVTEELGVVEGLAVALCVAEPVPVPELEEDDVRELLVVQLGHGGADAAPSKD
jgi:hypothetical protein